MSIDETQLTRLYIRFTPRQRQIAHLVSEGMTNQEIADHLCIAPSVVAWHLTNIYGEICNLQSTPDLHPKRYHVIRLFAGFLQRHPEYDPFEQGLM